MNPWVVGLIVSVGGGAQLFHGATAAVAPHMAPRVACDIAKPGVVVRAFMSAVKDGQLKVFDTAITPEMLIPVRVESSCELADMTSRTKVYMEIREPLQVPWKDAVEVRALSVIMNRRGEVVDSELHLWPMEIDSPSDRAPRNEN